MTDVRCHCCPSCGRVCNCDKGWRVLDNNPKLELDELDFYQCDCKHKEEQNEDNNMAKEPTKEQD